MGTYCEGVSVEGGRTGTTANPLCVIGEAVHCRSDAFHARICSCACSSASAHSYSRGAAGAPAEVNRVAVGTAALDHMRGPRAATASRAGPIAPAFVAPCAESLLAAGSPGNP